MKEQQNCLHRLLFLHSVVCQKNKCKISYEEIAEETNIFFYSKNICAGDEIDWDFIRSVKVSKISFNGFCNQMTRQYGTTHKDADPFMSLKTSISWFFGWLSAFPIDFWKHIDPFCHDPTILACNGTHIGVSIKHLNLEGKDTDEIISTAYFQYDCILFSEEFVPIYMKYLSKKCMKLLMEENIFSKEQFLTYINYPFQATTVYTNSLLAIFLKKCQNLLLILFDSGVFFF